MRQILGNLVSNAVKFTHSGYVLIDLRHEVQRPKISDHNASSGESTESGVNRPIKKNILTVYSITPDQTREANKSKEERCIDELAIERAQETGEEEYTVCFRVIDTGIGVSKDKANEIFLPFTQEDIAHTRVYGGTGECGLLTRTRGKIKEESLITTS